MTSSFAGSVSSEAIAADVVRLLLDQSEQFSALMTKLVLADEALMTLNDVLKQMPHGRTKVVEMVQRSQIPMVKVEGRWLITWKAFRKARDAGFRRPHRIR